MRGILTTILEIFLFQVYNYPLGCERLYPVILKYHSVMSIFKGIMSISADKMSILKKLTFA